MTKRRGSWNDAEDARLALAVTGYGPSWADISGAIPGRSSDQCRERWADIQAGATSLAHAKWTLQQDEQLIKVVRSLGKKWNDVSKELGLGFTAKQVCLIHYQWLHLTTKFDSADNAMPN
jgi:hypothetical protein